MKRRVNFRVLAISISLFTSLYCAEVEQAVEETARVPVTTKSLHPAEIPPQDYSPMATLPREIRRQTIVDSIINTSSTPQEAVDTLKNLAQTDREFAKTILSYNGTQAAVKKIVAHFKKQYPLTIEESVLMTFATPAATKVLRDIFMTHLDKIEDPFVQNYKESLVEQLRDDILKKWEESINVQILPAQKTLLIAALTSKTIKLSELIPNIHWNPIQQALKTDDPAIILAFISAMDDPQKALNDALIDILKKYSTNSPAILEALIKAGADIDPSTLVDYTINRERSARRALSRYESHENLKILEEKEQIIETYRQPQAAQPALGPNKN